MIKYCISLLILFNYSVKAQDSIDYVWNSKKDYITIPFELKHNLIILDVELNNVSLKMIYDTGSSENLIFSNPTDVDLEFFKSNIVKISGFGKEDYQNAIISSGNTIKINDIKVNNSKIILIPDSKISLSSKLGFEINGLIGNNFFENYIVEINYVKKKIKIHKSERILHNNKIKKYSKEPIEIINKKCYLNLNAKTDSTQSKLKLLIDSGLSESIWLFSNVNFDKKNTNYIEDILGTGLSGEIHGKRFRIQNLKINKFEFQDVLITSPDSIFYNKISIIKDRNGSIGGELLKRFNLILDYKKHEIYLLKNDFYDDEFKYNMSGINVVHDGVEFIKEQISYNNNNSNVNVNHIVFDDSSLKSYTKFTLKPVYLIDFIRNNSPADLAGLKQGDKIISINNKKAYNYTIQSITDLFQSEDGKKINIEIDRNGVLLKFRFYLKKII